MTSRQLRFHAAAREEAEAAIRWYEDRVPGLGSDFATEIERAIAQIEEAPTSWPASPDDQRARRLVLSRFPYAVVYLVGPTGDIVVAAIAHGKRQPGYWQERLRSEH